MVLLKLFALGVAAAIASAASGHPVSVAPQSASSIRGQAAVERRIGDLPQKELVLGDPEAPVELEEFGDLQCPICKAFAEEQLPRLIEGPIAAGNAKLRFANFDIIGPQSITAATAALAAGRQGRGWQFIELFLRNQRTENSGYVSTGFLDEVAEAAGIEDIPGWNAAREAPELSREAEASTREAEKLGLVGTPSFAITGPRTHGLKLLGTPSGPAALIRAIKRAG